VHVVLSIKGNDGVGDGGEGFWGRAEMEIGVVRRVMAWAKSAGKYILIDI